MPENKSVYLKNVWNRERWVKERDDKKHGPVPKGAAKVNMGESLAKFHKLADQGVKAGYPAIAGLKKTIETYKGAVKTKYPVFHKLIEDKLEKALENYAKESKAIVDGVGNYGNLREAASAQMLVAGAEFQHWEKTKQGDFKPSNEKKLVEALNAYYTVLEKATFYSDVVTLKQFRGFKNIAMGAVGGDWSKKVVDELVKQLKELPKSI
jgi:hypothetical protein